MYKNFVDWLDSVSMSGYSIDKANAAWDYQQQKIDKLELQLKATERHLSDWDVELGKAIKRIEQLEKDE